MEPTSLRTAGDIVLNDFSITLPQGFTGQGSYRVINRGVQPHEVNVVRLTPGKTMEDLKTWVAKPTAGPPPAIPLGGGNGISRGVVNYVHLNLPPGNYVALCLIPDPGSGKPHVALGMLAPFQLR